MTSFAVGHVSLVTGSSTGIGAATAVALASRGSTVAVHYNNSKAAADGIVDRISKAGGQAAAFQADLSTASTAGTLVDRVLGEFGRIDVLVNNAGSLVGRRTLLDITDEFWREAMEINLNSVLRMTRAVARQMMARKSGAIVNVASVSARNGGSPGVMPYAAAKAAVVCMTKSLAKELIVHGIRVNAVNPGIIQTPIHDKFTPPDRMKALLETVPQGRAGTSEEVATLISFLAGEESSYIVGESIEINGGMWME
jgi:NAD(P)-dependent dehydrogenase (short-subunit alcohol dehydrogenase family)